MVLRSPPAVLFVCLVAFLSMNCGDNGTPASNSAVLCAQAACAANATCTITGGAARCACPAGTDDVGGTGKMCLDHNECADTPAPCDVNATCTNQSGSFTCACKTGYSGNGKTCADVNECGTANGGCDTNATCANAPGARTCACKPGFTGDGITCADVDECQTANGACDANAICANTSGGRSCTCKAGYAGDGATCADVDECATNNGGCAADALCSNNGGGRVCTCKSGFAGNGVTCTDVNECATNNGGCDPVAPCNNLPGAFTCGNCPVGYTGGGAGGCVEVNECTADTDNCAAQADCTNTPGAFSCQCKPGFTGTGVACNTCRTCVTGQYQSAACTPTTDAICFTCPLGCASCTGANSCTSCAPGRYLLNGACVACATCGAGQFQSAACTPTQNTVCSSCATCPSGQHQTGACGGSSDTACGGCSTCGAGQYQTNACTPTSDTACATCDTECLACTGPGSCTTCAPGHYLISGVCVACTTCLPGEFQATACTATQNTHCTTCSTCAAGQFPSTSCTATADTVCSTCATCGSGTYQTAACGSSDTACGTCATCGAGQYQTTACTPTTNRVCSGCNSCGAGFFQTAACMTASDTACSACSTCAAGTYRSAACAGTSDTACSTCATCATGQYVTAACTSIANTACGACDAHCNACTGPGACTVCAGGLPPVSGVCPPPSASCRTLLAAHPGTPDGVYLLDPDQGSSANAFLAYCDMTTDGGGWTKILQYANDAYTPSADAIGDIAVAGTPAAAKLSDANINALGALGAAMEYRFQGDLTTKKLYMKVSAPWDDLARSHGLMLNGTALACEDTTLCPYVVVNGRPAIDSNDWAPSSIGGTNNHERYFTDYSATPQCFITGSTTTRCYGSGATTGHILIPNFSIWVREAPAATTLIYKLDENAGTTVADTSGNSRGATVAVSGSWVAGHTGSAYTGGFRTDAVVPVSTDITVSMWVRRDGPGGGFSRILSFHDDLELADAFTSDNIAFHTQSTGWQMTGVSFGSGFHHLAVTVGGGTVTLYFDGLSIYTMPGTVNLAYQMSVGTRWNDSESWNGAIDQVRVYDGVLNAAQILTLSQE